MGHSAMNNFPRNGKCKYEDKEADRTICNQNQSRQRQTTPSSTKNKEVVRNGSVLNKKNDVKKGNLAEPRKGCNCKAYQKKNPGTGG